MDMQFNIQTSFLEDEVLRRGGTIIREFPGDGIITVRKDPKTDQMTFTHIPFENEEGVPNDMSIAPQ